VSCDPTRDLDHLTYGVPVAAAQVVDHLVTFLESLQRKQMRGYQVSDVDVIADAGSVRCWIIGTDNVDRLALSQWHTQHKRNEMRFRLMGFAAPGQRTAGIKVTKRGIMQA